MTTRKLKRGVKFIYRAWQDRAFLKSILLSDNYQFLKFAPPGHFYSPIPDMGDIRNNSETIFDRSKTRIPGIDLRAEAQAALARDFAAYYRDIPFPHKKQEGYRYYFDNSYFSYGDGLVLYSMMRHFKPRRIVEVGSGYSSAAMLDVNEIFYNNQIDFTFIEPFPDRLYSLVGTQDAKRYRIYEKPVQQIPESVFGGLQENDILFVDSSHIAKVHSDVAHLLFNIIPGLNAGVIVHFHDILWPFEYPRPWFEQGRAWNEAYILRAFLQYNHAFRILYFNSMVENQHRQLLAQELPLAMTVPSSALTPGNTSLWIQKVQ